MLIKRIIIAGLLVNSSLAFAVDTHDYMAPGAEAFLSFESEDRTLLVNNSEVETQIDRIRFTAYESPLAWLQGGLHFGALNLSQTNNAATNGMHPSGEFIGIQFRNSRDYQRTFNLHAYLDYTYNRVDDKNATDSVDLEWHQYDGELGLTAKVSNVDLSLGGYYSAIDGEQSGTLSSNATFEQKDSSGGYASLSYWFDKTGRMQIHGKQGAVSHISILFSRYY